MSIPSRLRPRWATRTCTCLALAAAAPVWAGHPLISDDTGTQGAGHWQLEINTDHARTRENGARNWERQANATLAWGAGDALDLAVNLPYLRTSGPDGRARGVGDVTLQAKWRFLDNGAGWTLGLRPALTLPSGSERKGLGNGRATADLTLISTLEAGDWTWLANAGYTHNANKAGDRRHLWAASTAALYKLGEQWTLAADLGISRAASRDARTDKAAVLGLIHHLRDDIDLDIGYTRSLGGGPRTHGLGVGLALRW